MKTKRIANIVFYKSFGNDEKNACIFYNDGTSELVSYDEGLKACEKVVEDRKILTKNAFKEMINKEIVHVMSESEFKEKFDSFITYDLVSKDEIDEVINEEIEEVEVEPDYSVVDIDEDLIDNDELELIEEDKRKAFTQLYGDDVIPFILPDGTIKYDNSVDTSYDDPKVSTDTDLEDTNRFASFTNMATAPINDIPNIDGAKDRVKKYSHKAVVKEKGLKGILKRGIERIKENNIATKVTACAVALALGFGLYSCAAKQTKEGQMRTDSIAASQSNDSNSRGADEALIEGNNEYYNNYSFEQLLEVTTNHAQKQAMNKIGFAIQNYNGKFANAHLESGKDVRAALSFDELVALQQAYNDYSKKDILAIFNGADIRSGDLTRAYKDASLQLMGAHVIETRENPVDMSNLIESEEGKEFYQRYHEMFLAAKEATGEEKIQKVNEFYKAVRTDFPITEEIRTEGIAHADAYKSIEPYKLSVTPMIAAAEMMYQNLDTDYTLNDSEIDFLNDIGLCNYANDTFERIEMIVLSHCEDDMENPLYEQYRSAIIDMMKSNNQYVIDDAHRDLSRLDAFQDQVNWHFEMTEEGAFTGQVIYSTETYTETNSWSETKTTATWTETTIEEKPIPASKKKEIDAQIEKENKEAKEIGERKAEQTRQEMQQKEERHADQVREEVRQDEQDLQQKIEEANEQINDNNKDYDTSNDKPVNESDFGDHNVDFDSNHSDNQGNLNDSVEEITTDPTDVKTPADLPDPNVTGAEFDRQAEMSAQSTKSNEELVDEYIESLANSTYDEEKAKEYTK